MIKLLEQATHASENPGQHGTFGAFPQRELAILREMIGELMPPHRHAFDADSNSGRRVMMRERWEKVAELFEGAVSRSPEERAAFLDEACASDESLRREVETLLASHQDEDGALDKIASDVRAAGIS
jgi:hypothetical protein